MKESGETYAFPNDFNFSKNAKSQKHKSELNNNFVCQNYTCFCVKYCDFHCRWEQRVRPFPANNKHVCIHRCTKCLMKSGRPRATSACQEGVSVALTSPFLKRLTWTKPQAQTTWESDEFTPLRMFWVIMMTPNRGMKPREGKHDNNIPSHENQVYPTNEDLPSLI